MSYQKVERGFFIDGKWVDVFVCANCNGIHLTEDEAKGC